MRSFLSIPVLLVTMAGLAGCYDLSAPSGPRREDFMGDSSASEPTASEPEQQGEQAQAERSEQAAMAATKAITASDPAKDEHALPANAMVLRSDGADLSMAEYVARYIHPAPGAD